MRGPCTIALLGIMAAVGMGGRSHAAASFALEDFLGRDWRNEAVTFSLTPEDRKVAEAGVSLLDENGNPVAYQIIEADEKTPGRILFQTDLKPFGRAAFQFGEEKSARLETGVHVEETAEEIRLTNGQAGIVIRKGLRPGEGPIAGILLRSGKWAGESRLSAEPALTSWEASLVESGPVRARVVCSGVAEDGKTLQMSFVMLAGQPEILVDEKSSLTGGEWVLHFADAFRPTNLYYRSYPVNRGAIVTPPLEGREGVLFHWEPWAAWWLKDSGKWFGAYDDTDFITLGARNAEAWVDPAASRKDRGALDVSSVQGALTVTFPLASGERRWLIASMDRAASLAVADGKTLEEALPPQKLVIRHEFPLERIKDYVLDWQGTEEHPHLLINKETAETLRKGPPPEGRPPTGDITIQTLDNFLQYYLRTGDADMGKKLAGTLEDWMRKAVNAYFKQGEHYSFGFAPHHSQQLIPLANLADAMLGSEALDDATKARLRAQAAFLGYTVSRPDYWSPERGFSANPNMTTFRAGYQVALGGLISSHPQARDWVREGLRELKRELEEWSDDNGGWLEAPHYAMASSHFILGGFLMARNSGFEDHVHDPRMKKVMEFFAKITTPPDPRFGGLRHHPPIGNTFRFEVSNQYAIVAKVWEKVDPEFSANMQWMYRQEGSPNMGGASGSWPVMAGYRPLFIDDHLPEKAPRYGSELFPETGVVLRNTYNSGNETMLYMIAGEHYQHYDYDSGSITLWGKGEPIADEFGYNGRAPVSDHSMVETPYSSGLNMRIQTFASAPEADYVHGKLDQWDRQILFLKDEDPLAPNYFFVSDTLLGNAPATWRLYLTGNHILTGNKSARFSGDGRVGADIHFLQPGELDLTVEPRTRDIHGLAAGDQSARTHPITLHALTAKAKTRRFNTLIYPRLKDEKPAAVSPLADGRGVCVVTDAGKDYLFLSNKPFHFKEGVLEFEGTAGAVRVRNKGGTLVLGEKGRISFKGQSLESDKPAQKSW